MLDAVGYRVTTLGSKGVEIVAADGSRLAVGALPEKSKTDPTGVGDAFRAGFLAGQARGAGARAVRAAGVADGHADAGDRRHPGVPAGHDVARVRLADAYGEDAAADIAHALRW